MQDTLADIRMKLREGAYENEEHVRFALVGRVLQKLGWDIWDPRHVYAEYVPAPDEDRTKVDFALFSKGQPAVFIEVKAVGKAKVNLEDTEKQLRNYNRDITAVFCVITDGEEWRLYYSKSPGAFASKCFKVLNLVSDDLEYLMTTLPSLLSKANLDNGEAEKEAQTHLSLSQKQKAMEECLLTARRMIQEPPYPSLPDALCRLVLEKGFTVTRMEAEDFIRDYRTPRLIEEPVHGDKDEEITDPEGAIVLDPDHPESLRFAKVVRARFGDEVPDRWNYLVDVGIKMAVARGHGIDDLRGWRLSAKLEQGTVTNHGFHPVRGTRMSVQGMDANKAWENALALAKRLRLPIRVEFRWGSDEGAANPGRPGLLHWLP